MYVLDRRFSDSDCRSRPVIEPSSVLLRTADMPGAHAGTLKVIAITDRQRSAALPDVSATAESPSDAYRFSTRYVLFALWESPKPRRRLDEVLNRRFPHRRCDSAWLAWCSIPGSTHDDIRALERQGSSDRKMHDALRAATLSAGFAVGPGHGSPASPSSCGSMSDLLLASKPARLRGWRRSASR